MREGDIIEMKYLECFNCTYVFQKKNCRIKNNNWDETENLRENAEKNPHY